MKAALIVVQSMYDRDPRVRRKAAVLVAAGFSVDVLALRTPGRPKSYTLEGVDVRTLSLGKKRGSPGRYLFEYVVFFAWALVRTTLQMRRRRYVVIDINTLPDFLVFAAAAAKWMGACVLLDMHEITPEFYMSKYGVEERSWLVRLLKWQERVSFAFANHVLVVNEPIQELLDGRGLSRSKSTVLMNAADESRFVSARRSPAAGKAARPDKYVMVYHGTLTHLYGLDIAIEAFGRAHAEMDGAEFWIIGGGPEAPALSAIVERYGLSDKVKFVGEVSPERIPELLRECTVGVLPTRRDVFLDFAFPNKLAELVVMGKPAIVSRLKAIRTYFSEGAMAFFAPNDPADLARRMVEVYQDAELRDFMARRARLEYVGIRWDVMKDRYLTIVDSLANRTHARALRPQDRVA